MRGPQRLSESISELLALRGLGRVRADADLQQAWRLAVGDEIADQTRVIGLKRGVLSIAVSNSPLLSELALFDRAELLTALRASRPELRIRDLRFRLQGRN